MINTCAFDTIVSIVCINYYDSPKYRDFILSITNNEFLQFCKFVAIYGASKKEYIQRLELLKKCNILGNPLSSIADVECYDANCNIQQLIKNLKLVTGEKISVCCKCHSKTIEPIEMLCPNMKKIAHGGFENTLHNEIETIIKEKRDYCNKCTDHSTITYITIHLLLIIEVDLLGYYGKESCSLSSIPKNLVINDKK